MIPADKRPMFSAWFSRDAHRRIERAFSEVRVHGIAALRAHLAEGPVLVVSNHTAWWDPLVAIALCHRVLRCDAYAMMDARNLEKLPFFARVGAFGVDLNDAADGARAIRYAAKLLAEPGRLVWVFAQGREVPVTVRPLGFRPGTAEIARVARKATVVPLALRYEMGSRPEPALWISIGEALSPERDTARARAVHEAAVVVELDRIERALGGADDEPFEVLHRKTEGGIFAAASAALAWFTRPKALP